jgi:hypothetical protein
MIDVEHLADRETRQTEVGNVHEGKDAAAGLGNDPMAEPAEVITARVTGADVRRRRRAGNQLVGR